MPSDLIRVFDRDLAAAGIPKVDDRGRTVDVHALRATFASHLSRAGVAPRTARAALRHSTLDLTMNVYTDPQLLDVAGALDALPELPLDSRPGDADGAKATGTDGRTDGPNPGNPCTFESTADTTADPRADDDDRDALPASAALTNEKAPPEELERGFVGAGDED